MGRYVTVVISTEGSYQVGSRGWGDIGMIGRSVATGVGAGELNTAYVITSPSDAQTLFGGDSALYNSILLAFDNGATKVLAVPTDVTEQLPETFNGDDSTTEFELTSIPTQPIDEVTLGGVPQTEGVDFYVDYGMDFNDSGYQVLLNSVPGPATMFFFGSGLLGLAGIREN